MLKEEILEKSRKENLDGDERDKLLQASGGMVGMCTVFVAAVAFSLIKTFVLHTPSNDVLAIAFLGWSAANVYQYVKTRRRTYLAGAIAFFAAAALFIFGYVSALNGVIF